MIPQHSFSIKATLVESQKRVRRQGRQGVCVALSFHANKKGEIQMQTIC